MIMRFERKNCRRRRRRGSGEASGGCGRRAKIQREGERGGREAKVIAPLRERARAGGQIYGGRRRSFKLRQQQLLKQQLVTRSR